MILSSVASGRLPFGSRATRLLRSANGIREPTPGGTDTGWNRDWDFQRVWNRPDNPDNAGSYYGPQLIDFNGERRLVEGYSTDNYTQWACDYILGEGRDADEGVGRLIAALDESGQLQNTLVIYTSDQGFANGEHGLKQKVAPYEAAYSSPFIVSQPGRLPQGKVCPQTVNAPDVVVTFFAQAGIPLPWKMHGRDFSSLLTDPEHAPWERPTLFEHAGQHYGSDVTAALAGQMEAVHAGVPYYAAVRQGDVKYVRYLAGDEPEELYDLSSDPDELNNLAFSPEHQSVLHMFREKWMQEMRHSEAPFLDSIPVLPAAPATDSRACQPQ